MNLQPGKLPAALLGELLGALRIRDPRVVLGPGTGRDAAVIDLGDRLLVAKTDPITFAMEQAGWYAVHVNANDIACMGARPAWFLATILLPPGCDEALARDLFSQITDACGLLGIDLIGGHTEITLGIDRPLIAGAMLGEATATEFVRGDDVAEGDAVLLTKGIAIEGTALLAREVPGVLRDRRIDEKMVVRAVELLFTPGISVVPDAAALRSVTKPKLMHDPTEGGLATALHEMATRAGRELHVRADAVRVLDETRAVCEALELDPLGLLASGALLAIVEPSAAEAACMALRDAGIACDVLGRVGGGPPGVIMTAENRAMPLPAFARDEIARFFDTPAGAHGARTPEQGRN